MRIILKHQYPHLPPPQSSFVARFAITCFVTFLTLILSQSSLLALKNEHELGEQLALNAKTEFLRWPEERIYFEARHDLVTLNVYGVMDSGRQRSIIEALQPLVDNLGNNRPKIVLNFFTPRKEFEELQANGIRTIRVQKPTLRYKHVFNIGAQNGDTRNTHR
jgi:hypothetical protein